MSKSKFDFKFIERSIRGSHRSKTYIMISDNQDTDTVVIPLRLLCDRLAKYFQQPNIQ